MAQSALKDSGKSPLGIQPFWEKATLGPPLRWEHWRTQLKLAILAREGIEVDLLLADPRENVILPLEPAYEDEVENPTAQSERDRSTRNEQAKTSTFIQIHNITFDRYLFLTRKQQKGEPIEKFYGHLKELLENCDL